MDITTSSSEILKAVRSAGADAQLSVNDVGEYQDVLLWESAEDAEDDDGTWAIGRWAVTAEVAQDLRAAGVVNA